MIHLNLLAPGFGPEFSYRANKPGGRVLAIRLYLHPVRLFDDVAPIMVGPHHKLVVRERFPRDGSHPFEWGRSSVRAVAHMTR